MRSFAKERHRLWAVVETATSALRQYMPIMRPRQLKLRLHLFRTPELHSSPNATNPFDTAGAP